MQELLQPCLPQEFLCDHQELLRQENSEEEFRILRLLIQVLMTSSTKQYPRVCESLSRASELDHIFHQQRAPS